MGLFWALSIDVERFYTNGTFRLFARWLFLRPLI